MAVVTRGAVDIVGPEIDEAQVRADQAIAGALEFVEDLDNFVENFDLQQSTVDLGSLISVEPGITPVEANLPDVPTDPQFNINLPAIPADFDPNSISTLSLTSLGAFPELTDTSPTVSFPSQPAAFSGTAPVNTLTIKDDFVFPTSPTTTLPAVPTLQSLSLPTLSTITLPTFSEAVPVPDLVVPGQTFAFTESPYSSTLLTDVSSELLSRLTKSTGLNTNVEAQLWDRARNRESLNATRSREENNFDNAQTGFSRPSGSMFAANSRLAQDTQNKIADLSREIAIKQADLEQENFKNTVSNILSLEATLIQNNNNIQERSFQAARFAQEVSINLFNAKVAAFGLQVEGYKLYELEFRSKLSAELSKLDVFKGELDSQRLINEINKTDIDLYTSQVQAVQTIVQTFKIEVDAVSSQIQAEGLKVQNFKSLVDVFAAEVGAKRDEFQAFGTAVDAESKKVDVYSTQVQAFSNRVQAYGQGVDAKKKIIDVDIDKEKLRLQSHVAKLDLFGKNIQAEVSAYQAQTETFKAQASIYGAQIDAEKVKLDNDRQNIDNKIQLAKAKADVAISNANINIKNADSANQLTLDAIKSGATVQAQLAASALSGIQIGANISSQFSQSENQNTNISVA